MKLVSLASNTLSGPRRISIFLYSEITMYETLVRPIEVFQIPPLQPISIVSEKLKRSELKREDKRLRQIAANKAAAAAASAKRKRDAGAADGNVDGSLNAATGLPHGTGQTGRTSKRVKTEEDDSVPQMEEQDINMDVDVEATVIGSPSTSAFPLVNAVDPTTTTTLSMSTPDVVADIPISTPPAKINVSKALPEVRGHTSYLTFACLIPIPGFSAAPPEAATDDTSSE